MSARGAQPVPVGPYKLASVLLQYPTTSLFDGLDTVDGAIAAVPNRAARESLAHFISWLRESSPEAVGEHYVETFDLRRRSTLYLTYYRHGDTRMRGMSMIEFTTAYRTAGMEPPEADLPDYLPLVLEFADLHPRGEQLLRRHRADLELLRGALESNETPYVSLIDAVVALLPRMTRRERVLVARARESGPPREDVGLEPYGQANPRAFDPQSFDPGAPNAAPFAPPEYLEHAGGRP